MNYKKITMVSFSSKTKEELATIAVPLLDQKTTSEVQYMGEVTNGQTGETFLVASSRTQQEKGLTSPVILNKELETKLSRTAAYDIFASKEEFNTLKQRIDNAVASGRVTKLEEKLAQAEARMNQFLTKAQIEKLLSSVQFLTKEQIEKLLPGAQFLTKEQIDALLSGGSVGSGESGGSVGSGESGGSVGSGESGGSVGSGESGGSVVTPSDTETKVDEPAKVNKFYLGQIETESPDWNWDTYDANPSGFSFQELIEKTATKENVKEFIYSEYDNTGKTINAELKSMDSWIWFAFEVGSENVELNTEADFNGLGAYPIDEVKVYDITKDLGNGVKAYKVLITTAEQQSIPPIYMRKK